MRIIKITLAIWLIAMFVCSSGFTDKAAADEMEAVKQIFLGYIAGGGAGLLGGCVGGCAGFSSVSGSSSGRTSGRTDEIISYSMAIGSGLGAVLASSAAIYAIGEEDGSFGWTLAGALAPPLVGAGISGISKSWKPFFTGLLLTPISATIAYQLTKKGDEPSNVNIAAPIIRVRF